MCAEFELGLLCFHELMSSHSGTSGMTSSLHICERVDVCNICVSLLLVMIVVVVLCSNMCVCVHSPI